jgi:hypothetical protein
MNNLFYRADSIPNDLEYGRQSNADEAVMGRRGSGYSMQFRRV